jgi:hypothetical protein
MKLKELSQEELKEFKKAKPLYMVVKSTRASKKGMVYVRRNNKPYLIHFGDSSMEDYHDHKDEKRRKSYLARAKGIMKNGQPTYLDRNSANYYSVKFLWDG